MLHQQFGSRLLGFSGVNQCENCHNQTPMLICQDFAKNKAFLIPIGTQYSSVFRQCPICEAKEHLIKWTPAFSSAETMENLYSLFAAGKEYTKDWFINLAPDEQHETLKRLNGLRAYELVKFLGLPR